MGMKPEDLDMGIINLLKTDARISIKDMAQSLGVSPATVSKRIKKLENLGYIKGYVTILDDSKIGFGCRLMLLIRTSGSADVRKLGEKLADMDESCIALLCAGSYDVVAVLNCKTQEDASQMIENIRKMGGVERIDSLIIIDRLKLLNKKLYQKREEKVPAAAQL